MFIKKVIVTENYSNTVIWNKNQQYITIVSVLTAWLTRYKVIKNGLMNTEKNKLQNAILKKVCSILDFSIFTMLFLASTTNLI